MDFLRSKKRKEQDTQDMIKEAQLIKERNELENKVSTALNSIIVYAGSKADFEDQFRCKTEWVTLEGPLQGLLYDTSHKDNPFRNYSFENKKKIMELGIVALVSASYSHNGGYTPGNYEIYFGIPVKMKPE